MAKRAVVACLVVFALGVGGAPVLAQPTAFWPDPTRQTTTRPFELIVGIDDLTSIEGRGQDLRLSVGIPRSERMTIELFGGAYRGNEKDWDISAVAGFQMRQRLMRLERRDQELFLTYGTVFLLGRSRCEYRSCINTVDSLSSLPPLGTFGVGFQQSIASRVALRAELQAGLVLFIPVGVRVAAGVTIPLGSKRVPRGWD